MKKPLIAALRRYIIECVNKIEDEDCLYRLLSLVEKMVDGKDSF